MIQLGFRCCRGLSLTTMRRRVIKTRCPIPSAAMLLAGILTFDCRVIITRSVTATAAAPLSARQVAPLIGQREERVVIRGALLKVDPRKALLYLAAHLVRRPVQDGMRAPTTCRHRRRGLLLRVTFPATKKEARRRVCRRTSILQGRLRPRRVQ